MSTAVGIDLGTTNSAIAHVDGHGRPVVLPNRFGEPITPSVVCFRKGEVLVGQEAKELQATGEPQVAAFFKRQMGVPNFVFYADGRDYTAIDLSALVLASLKRDAEQALGGKVTHAVITVPAYFRNPQREATIAAGRQAGLEVLQVINEPTAAAIAYGVRGAEREQTLLVYDLGGGTFDTTLLRLGHGEIRILNSEGDHELGGKDWDDRIVEFLGSRFASEHGADPLDDLESLADLQVRAEEVKKRLSTAESAPISLVHDGRRGRYELDRATFERITADLMERTIELTRKVLDDQKMKPAQVDGVLLVGGSTRLPMVHDFIQRAFGRPPMTGVNVDEAVALGAALVATERQADGAKPRFALGGVVKTIDVTNHSLGMIALNEDRASYLNSVILPKNTAIPCQKTQQYQHRTRRTGENFLEVYTTQGESGSPADVSYLGKYVLHDIPYADGGRTVIDVEYSYDESGTVKVTGRVQGKSLRLTVEPLPPDVPERFLKPPEESVEAVHVIAYLAFDLSGSMTGAPLAEAKKAAKSFLQNTNLDHCSIGIIAFADEVKVKLEASQDSREIKRAIDALSIGEVGGCNGAHPFDKVCSVLSQVDEPKFVITLADGVWSCQPEAIRSAKSCHAAGIESIAIGFGSADEKFLRAIASSDEASFFTSLGGLVETFTNIAQVLRDGTSTAAPRPQGGSRFSFLGLGRR
ncbi:MAG: molecular chaperone DnaK [Acidobacteriota bacterium]|jgi:molecular chaperone DnaK (HSP70)|nr:molecular chaperone DnaK [Acidobacteriota bacterium]